LRQTLFLAEQTWVPPFSAAPLVLDANLRNTRPIGELALKLAGRSEVAMYRVNDGLAPRVQASADFATMADQLKALLRELLGAQAIKPEQVVVLSLYKHTNAASRWAQGLQDVAVSTDMAQPTTGKVRVGTVQSFKGMEADVVILVGLDPHALTHPEVLYVGASRARAALYVLALRGVVDEA
jgi:superfamily I DNA/RNA helicase